MTQQARAMRFILPRYLKSFPTERKKNPNGQDRAKTATTTKAKNAITVVRTVKSMLASVTAFFQSHWQT
jgi:hypothetical protein